MDNCLTTAAPLSALLGDTWEFFRTHLVPIVGGAVVTGIILALLNIAFLAKLQPAGEMFVNRLGMSDERLAELRTRIQAGDQAAMAEMQLEVERAFKGREGEMVAMGRQLFVTIAPAIAVSALVWMLLSIVYGTYIYLLVLKGGDPMHLVSQSAGYFLPMVGLSVWIFLRTFFWIPIVGVILAIILGPRFALAGVILIKEKRGVLESARESYERTVGYWGKIVGNGFIAVLCVGIAVWVVSMLVGFLGLGVALIVKPVLQMLAIAFLAIFKVKLSLTIMEHSFKRAA